MLVSAYSVRTLPLRCAGQARLAAPLARRPAGRGRALVRPAAAPAAPPPTVWASTGVPLLDDLASFATLKDAGIHGAKLVLAAAVAVYLGSAVLSWINSKADRAEDAGKRGRFDALAALVSSASQPASVLLSFYGMAYSATVASALVQVAASKHATAFNALFAGNGAQALQLVKHVTQLVQDAGEVVIIIGVAWTLIHLKNHAMAYLQHTLVRGGANSGLARILGPASTLLTYGITAAGALASLAAFGINLNPLLASLGASSVVIGLATQRILGNVASALTLYTSPMFVAGDRVKFLADGGAVLVQGTVLAVEPMRTLLRTPEGCTLYVQNSKVVEWITLNESQKV